MAREKKQTPFKGFLKRTENEQELFPFLFKAKGLLT